MGVVKRHQSVAPVKYFKDYISFVVVRISKERWNSVITVEKIYSWFRLYVLKTNRNLK